VYQNIHRRLFLVWKSYTVMAPDCHYIDDTILFHILCNDVFEKTGWTPQSKSDTLSLYWRKKTIQSLLFKVSVGYMSSTKNNPPLIYSNTCRLCKRADETAEHILCTCNASSLKRLYLGKANLTPEEDVSVAPRQVLNFYCHKNRSHWAAMRSAQFTPLQASDSV